MSRFQKLIASLGGKKFVAAILGVVAVVMTARLGFSEETTKTVVEWVGAVVASFLLGQGVSDGLSGGSTSATAQANEEAKRKDAG